MGDAFSNIANCSASSQSPDDISHLGRGKPPKPEKPKRTPVRTTKRTPKLSPRRTNVTSRRFQHHCPQLDDYSDFVDVIILVLFGKSSSEHRHPRQESIYIIAVSTASYLTSLAGPQDQTTGLIHQPQNIDNNDNSSLEDGLSQVPSLPKEQADVFLDTQYPAQMDQLRKLGLASLVSPATLYSLLSKCNGDVDLVIGWFEIREHGDTFDENFIPNADMFSPSLSTRNRTISTSSISSFQSSRSGTYVIVNSRTPYTEDTQAVYETLLDVGLERYFQVLVENGYDSLENLRYGRLEDFLRLRLKLGHARRIVECVNEMYDADKNA